ncbi:MAG: glycosyltransferase [Actinobacteria bacterium]|nr:glycosyltransferase [Actinomycetota bacterium]
MALCHEWTIQYAGSERVTAEIAKVIDPDSCYTAAVEGGTERIVFGDRRIETWSFGLRPRVRDNWPKLLPVLPLAWRGVDLGGHRLVVTSSHSCVNAVPASPGSIRLSYSHTPMRYAWCWREELRRVPRALQPAWPAVAAALRRADRGWSERVDAFACNSAFVAERIARFYGREATVVPPPVDVDAFTPGDDPSPRDVFVVVGRLVSYKRVDVAIRAAARAGVDLVVVGDGIERSRLEAMAGPNVRFTGAVDQEALLGWYRRARALVIPGVEDFGIGPLEAQACGTPVLARTEGGTSETVLDGTTGRLVAGEDVEAWADALASFDSARYAPAACRDNALRFSPDRFRSRFRAFVRQHAPDVELPAEAEPAEAEPAPVPPISGGAGYEDRSIRNDASL